MSEKLKATLVLIGPDGQVAARKEVPEGANPLEFMKELAKAGALRGVGVMPQDAKNLHDLTERIMPSNEVIELGARADQMAGEILGVIDEVNSKRIADGGEVSLIEIVLALVSVCATVFNTVNAPVDEVMDDMKEWVKATIAARMSPEEAEMLRALHKQMQTKNEKLH